MLTQGLLFQFCKKMKKTSLIILLVLMAGLVLRLISINQSLWLDEAIGALVVKSESYAQIITDFPKHDNHPPLYYLTLKGWSNIFGYSEPALRMLSVIFGILTVYLIYKIGERIDERLKFWPAFLLATSPLFIYYSQEARMYVMAAFLASAAFYLFLLTFGEKSQKVFTWVLFSITIIALVFTDYIPVFLLPVFPAIGLIKKMPRNWWKKLFLSAVPLVLLGFAWLPTFLFQSHAGRLFLQSLPGWSQVAGGATLKQAGLVWMKFALGRISFEPKNIYYTLVVIFSIPLLIALVEAWKKREKVIPIWLFLSVPLVLGFVASIFFPAFIYFRFIYVLPAFYLLVAWGIENFKKTVSLIIIAFIAAGNILGWLIYIKDPNQQREQWRQAVSFIESRSKTSDIAVFENPEPFAPYRWYAQGKLEAKGATDSILATQNAVGKTKLLLSNKSGVYYFEYLHDLEDPNGFVKSAISETGFKETAIFTFIGVGQITYFVK